jgi:hypothetical protein
VIVHYSENPTPLTSFNPAPNCSTDLPQTHFASISWKNSRTLRGLLPIPSSAPGRWQPLDVCWSMGKGGFGLCRITKMSLDACPTCFEIELSILVTVNHQLTFEGIDKMEQEEIAETRKNLELEDPELESQVRWQQTFF